jgi:predicted SprT family Zn-dependent metalloprotease
LSLPCKFCEKTFKTSLCLKNHIRYQHGDKQDSQTVSKNKPKLVITKIFQIALDAAVSSRCRFDCDSCDASFETKNDFRDHKLEVNTPTAIRCDECNKIFADSHRLNIHQKGVHQNVKKKQNKNYLCHICAFETKSEKKLNEHLKTHEEEYFCNLCPENYSKCNVLLQ